jgi:hypothetical protein
MNHRYHDLTRLQADRIGRRRRQEFEELTRLFAWFAVFLVFVTIVVPHVGGGW